MELSGHPELKKLNYSLTINYQNIVVDYKQGVHETFPKDEILRHLEDADSIKSFNLSFRIDDPVGYFDDYDDMTPGSYWERSCYIFHGEKSKIYCTLSFASCSSPSVNLDAHSNGGGWQRGGIQRGGLG